jgi:hypothetical protein
MDIVFRKKLLGNDAIGSGLRRKYNDIFHFDSSCNFNQIILFEDYTIGVRPLFYFFSVMC